MQKTVKLPHTETRRGAVYTSLTLIEHVSLDPHVPNGLAWQGKLYKPGSQIDRDLLIDAYVRHGRPVLALEHTEIAQSKAVNVARRKWLLLLILWRYDVEHDAWTEAARLVAPDAHTGLEFRKVAHRLLEPDQLSLVETIEASAGRLHSYIQSEVEQLQVDRTAVLERVLLRLLTRILQDRGAVDWPGRAGAGSQRVQSA